MAMVLDLKDSPCGRLVATEQHHNAFVPDPLPRHMPLSTSLVSQIDKATLSIGTLAGVGETIPNPNLLILPFLRKEAVLSSKIEGTQASLSDVFIFEASEGRWPSPDSREVINYVDALNHGIRRLDELPLCTRLSNELHQVLMQGVRGEDKRPGELREIQNWIRSKGTNIGDARYIPPPPDYLPDLMADWEAFVNEELEMPRLMQCALIHYQFEAIHPYVDGNGRIGRLLITLFLHARNVLPKPLLYLSAYFERNRDAYIDHLLKVSLSGDWEPWLEFFMQGVVEQAEDALERSRRFRQLHEQYRELLQEKKESANALQLLDALFINPYMTAPRAVEVLGITHAGAQGVINRLEAIGLLREIPGRWPHLYVAHDLLETLESPL